MSTKTINYYNANAAQFLGDTQNVDMSALYNQFLPLLPDAGRILDAGCGSGRDALAFKEQGFQVEAFDASEKMVQQAKKLLPKNEVKLATFLNYRSACSFDGIWACASLLHVPIAELPAVFRGLASLLKPKGVFYCSFKYGAAERHRNGREFTDLNEQRLHDVLEQTPLRVEKLWVTPDARPGRGSEKWLNAILTQ